MTPTRLRELFKYDAVTGEFARIVNRQRYAAGTIAGWIDAYGYRCIGIDGKSYKAHRLAWLWMTGEFPACEIDHIDGNPLNSRWENLRAADHGQNARNQKLRADNKSGFKGVRANCQKWVARIRVNGKTVVIGSFVTPEAAHAAYAAKASELFGEFARNG
jgi:HNH endonuclease